MNKNFKIFLKNAARIHGDKYSYDEINYVNGDTEINLYCKLHEFWFKTTCENHIHNKGGCPKCRYEKASKSFRKDKEYFVNKSTGIYGDRFDYSDVVYIKAASKVKIRCKEHDVVFEQSPDKHYQGVGCSKCVRNGYNRSKPGFIYVLKSESFIKIGITNRTVELRMHPVSKSSGEDFKCIFKYLCEDGQVAYDIELLLLKELRQLYEQPTSIFDGSTESFLGIDENVVTTRIKEELEKYDNNRPNNTDR